MQQQPTEAGLLWQLQMLAARTDSKTYCLRILQLLEQHKLPRQLAVRMVKIAQGANYRQTAHGRLPRIRKEQRA